VKLLSACGRGPGFLIVVEVFELVLDDNSFFPPSSTTSTPEADRSFPFRLLLLLPILKTVFHFEESVPLELLDGGVGRGGESDDLYADSDEGEAGRDASEVIVCCVRRCVCGTRCKLRLGQCVKMSCVELCHLREGGRGRVI